MGRVSASNAVCSSHSVWQHLLSTVNCDHIQCLSVVIVCASFSSIVLFYRYV